MIFQDGLQDELSSYADEVFETPSEAAVNQLDESELTGSPLDKNELERSHLMLWVHADLNQARARLWSSSVSPPASSSSLQPLGARLEEGQGWLVGPTQGAVKTGSGQRQPPKGPENSGSGQEAVCQGEAAVRTGHGGPAHQPHVPQTH